MKSRRRAGFESTVGLVESTGALVPYPGRLGGPDPSKSRYLR